MIYTYIFFFHHTTCGSTCDTLASSAAIQGDNTVSVAQGGTAYLIIIIIIMIYIYIYIYIMRVLVVSKSLCDYYDHYIYICIYIVTKIIS